MPAVYTLERVPCLSRPDPREKQGDLAGALMIRTAARSICRLVARFAGFGFRAMELLFAVRSCWYSCRLLLLGLDDDLRQFLGLAAGGPA